MNYVLHISNLGSIDKEKFFFPPLSDSTQTEAAPIEKRENCNGPLSTLYKHCTNDSFLITLHLLRCVINIF